MKHTVVQAVDMCDVTEQLLPWNWEGKGLGKNYQTPLSF